MSPLRVRKGAATRLGITLDEYDTRRAAGDKWCADCRSWHTRDLPADRAHLLARVLMR